MKTKKLVNFVTAGALLLQFHAQAAEIVKANNTNALNLGTSWTGGTVPGASDVAVWNNTVTAANSVGLGANTSWQGIKLTNPTGLVSITAGSTLTIGSAGIDIASTNAGLSILSATSLGANQSFVIGNSSAAQDLLFDSGSSGLAFDMGGFSVGASGAGTMRFTSGRTINNGTFNLSNDISEFQSGSSRTTTLNSNVTLNLASGKQLVFGINSAPGSGLAVSSAAAININGGTFQINSSGASGTNRLEQSGKVSFSGTSSVNNAAGFGYFSNFSGEIALAGTTTWTSSGSSTANTNISGPLTGSGTLVYRGTSTSHRTNLSGNNSSFSGTISINGASGNRNLRLTSATAGSSAATWTPAAGNTLEIDGVTVNLGTLNGAGTVTNSHATNAATISVGAGTFTGVISNGSGSGGLGLTKTGSGTLTLSGANLYSGSTSITGGTLATTTAQTGAGSFTVSDSATLSITQANASATFNASSLTLGSAGGATLTLTPTSNPLAALVTVGDLNVNGTTTLRLLNTPANGTTLIDYTNSIGGLNGFAGLSLIMPFRVTADLQHDTNNTSIIVTNVQPDVLKWKGNISNVWNIDTANNGGTGTANWVTSAQPSGAYYVEAGSTQIDSPVFDDSAAGNTNIALNTAVSPSGVTFDNSSLSYSISGTGSINGTTGIVKNGTGALTLATANTFSGGVQLNAGTLNINNASAIGSGALTISAGTVIDNTSGSAVTSSSPVTQAWNGDFTFTGSNDLNLGAGAVAMSASRQITVNGSTLSVGGVSGTGFGLTKEGAGTLAIGASTYTGATLINGGTLKANSTTSFTTTSSVTLADAAGAALDLNGNSQTISNLSGGGSSGGNIILGSATLTTGTAANASLGGNISGTGTLVKNGAGTLTLAGNNSGFTGATTVNGGVLAVGDLANNSLGSGALTLANNSVIEARGTLTRSLGNNNALVAGNGGFAAKGGDLTVNLFGDARLINLAAGSNALGGNFVLGSATANAKVTVLNPIGINNYNAQRTITVNAGAGGDSAELAGVVSNGAATGNNGINKQGNGTLILSAANTFSGSLKCNAGTIVLANNLAVQSGVIDTSGAGTYVITGYTTPSFGGFSGSVNLTTVFSAGYGDITALTINPSAGMTATYSGVVAEAQVGTTLTKSGAGTQNFTGVNTYTGNTTVQAGVLGVNGTSLSDTASLVITGGKVNLTGTEVVDKLFIAGAQKAAGTYGATGSGATHINDTYFSGTGVLSVTTGLAGFAGWAAENNVTGGSNGDSDADGIQNLVEYALNLNPAGSDGAAGSFANNTVSFTKRELAVTNGDVTYGIETSEDLVTWTVATPTVNDATTISYTLPTAQNKIFARLVLTLPTP